MENPQKKNGMHWLLMVIVIAGVVLLLATVLKNPSGELTKKDAIIAEDTQKAESDLSPGGTEPAEAAGRPNNPADLQREPPKDRQYSSGKPLFFRVVFGEKSSDSTLGVIDESGGTGTGYDVAYVDENRNGDLTDDAPKHFAKYESGSRSGETNPTFNFSGPFKNKVSAKYMLNIYTLARNTKTTPGDQYFFWTLDSDEWNYFFINGKIGLYSTAAEALAASPVHLGGECKWQITSTRRNGQAMVSAGLKDENGCTLRIIRRTGKIISPKLSLIKDGKVELVKDMSFG